MASFGMGGATNQWLDYQILKVRRFDNYFIGSSLLMWLVLFTFQPLSHRLETINPSVSSRRVRLSPSSASLSASITSRSISLVSLVLRLTKVRLLNAYVLLHLLSEMNDVSKITLLGTSTPYRKGKGTKARDALIEKILLICWLSSAKSSSCNSQLHF